MNRPNWEPTKNTRVCSDHFDEKFINRSGQRVTLKLDAIPTRFVPSQDKNDILFYTSHDHNYFPEDVTHKCGECSVIDCDQCVVEDVVVDGVEATLHTEIVNSEMSTTMSKKKSKVSQLREKLKVKQQKIRRLQTKVNTLEDLLNTLKDKQLISDQAQEALDDKYSGISHEIFQRLRKQKKSGSGIKYTPELKSFALTLQFYSTKAYQFVRKMFRLALPHPNVISSWYSKIPAEPGFTEPAFKALSLKVEQAKKQKKEVLTSLMFDEMSIKKHVVFDGKRFRGYVDVGDGLADDDAEVATEALVVMVVSLDGSFKIPIAYFFIKSMSGKEKANIVMLSIEKLKNIGVKVVSVTCDGPAPHFAMMRELGVSLNPENMTTFFTNDDMESKKTYIFLDVCHMLKNVRNILRNHELVDSDGNKISWKYIIELAKLQEREGLRYMIKNKNRYLKGT